MINRIPNQRLTYCVISVDKATGDAIRQQLRNIPIPTQAHYFFNSAEKLSSSGIDLSAIDFIATTPGFVAKIGTLGIFAPLFVFPENGADTIETGQNIFYQVTHPVNEKALAESLMKLENLKHYYSQSTGKAPQTLGVINKTFLTRKGKEFIPVNSKHIPAFYTDNKITFAYDEAGKKYMIDFTLIELENSLDNALFFRANRQFLINRRYIQRIRQLDEGRFEIALNTPEPLTVEINTRKFTRLKDWIEEYG